MYYMSILVSNIVPNSQSRHQTPGSIGIKDRALMATSRNRITLSLARQPSRQITATNHDSPGISPIPYNKKIAQ